MLYEIVQQLVHQKHKSYVLENDYRNIENYLRVSPYEFKPLGITVMRYFLGTTCDDPPPAFKITL
jgi:hypothetical protein